MKKIPKSVQKALRLLKRDFKGKRINRHVNVWSVSNCPLACVYKLEAVPIWDDGSFGLRGSDKRFLLSKGWNKTTYESFIKWHDKDETTKGVTRFKNREHILKILGGKKNAT